MSAPFAGKGVATPLESVPTAHGGQHQPYSNIPDSNADANVNRNEKADEARYVHTNHANHVETTSAAAGSVA